MARGDDESTELSRALLAHRRAAGLRQVEVVAQVKGEGVTQSRLSRIEQGKAVPSEADIVAFAALYRLDIAERDRLLALTRDALAGVKDTRLIVQRGDTLALQRRWRRIEGEAGLVREFHPALILGVLQTAAYAAAVFEEPIDSPEVVDRQARNQRMLTRDRPRFQLIQTEGALRYRLGSARLMAEQLDAIARASRRPNVEFGVIPWWREADLVTVCGFTIYDDAAVVVGLEVAAARLLEAADVAAFSALFERLRSVALWGDEARAELDRIAAETV